MALLDSNEAINARPVASRRAALKAAIRTDFYSFVQAAFPIVSGGKSLQLNWHLDAMTHALTDVIKGNTRRLIITVPPQSQIDLLLCSLARFRAGTGPDAQDHMRQLL